jgi:hypothetical protein
MFQTKVIEKLKAHILFSVPFPKNLAVCDTVEYVRARHVTGDI